MDLSEGLALVRRWGAPERWLAVLSTRRGDGAPGVSVVNAGVVAHPATGRPAVAFVARGGTAKLVNLRRDARAALTFRHGWEWVAVHGRVEIVGPDDPVDWAGPAQLRRLLREVYRAAGGEHPDLAAYDRVMAADRRAVVLLTPTRFTTNPPGAEHEEPA